MLSIYAYTYNYNKVSEVKVTNIYCGIKHWRVKTSADLAVDSQSTKILSANILFLAPLLCTSASYTAK